MVAIVVPAQFCGVARQVRANHRASTLLPDLPQVARCLQRAVEGESACHVQGRHLADRVTQHDGRRVAFRQPAGVVEYVDDRPFNDQRYYISNQKLKNLGWNINIKFEDGLQDLLILSSNISREENPESTFKNNNFILQPKSEVQEISEFFNENRKEKEDNNVSESISIF